MIECRDNSLPWMVDLKIHGKLISFKIDSGADTSVMSYDSFSKLRRPPCLAPAKSQLIGPSGSKLLCVGKFTAETCFHGKWFSFPVHVIKGVPGSNLLSRSVAEQMCLVKKIDQVESESMKNLFSSYGRLDCDPMKIVLQQDAKPYCLTTARRIPFPLQEKVQLQLNKLEKEGIIQKVTHPTDWCSPMVPVIKKNGDVRICVDFKKLNDSVKREHFVLPNLEDIAPDLKGASVFTKLDASSGFYQIPLDDASCELTTFITPTSRYCFRRVPFGITSAPEIFQRKMSELLCDLKGVKVIVDDILVYGRDMKDHDKNLSAVMQKIQSSGLKLNREKCMFRQGEVEYFGHSISKEGIQPSLDRVAAIQNMVPPTNVKELRRVVGMINYVGRFIPNLANIIAPMTDLLKDSNAWLWGSPQQSAFDRVKNLITEAPTLAFYNPNKPVVVSADASSYGLGGAIFQEENGTLKPVAYCSRKLAGAELKYAQIEKECLAALWTCDKFSRYLIGLKSFRLLTDHKPLVPLINTQDLNRAPLRCQRMLMRLRGYSLTAEHVPGKSLVVPDTLSRSPVDSDNYSFVNDIECYALTLNSLRPIADSRLEQIRRAAESDAVHQEAMSFTRFGWPKHMNSVRSELKDLFCFRSDLATTEGLLLYRNRIVVPKQIREEILDSIHQGHLGLNKCRARAQATVWWPEITKDIKRKVETCEFCQINRPAQRKEPMQINPLPDRPWQKVGADLCEINQKHYLVMTDYFSRYLEIAYLQELTSSFVIGKAKDIFARHGIPETLVSDNGPQFASGLFQNFAKKYGFRHVFSSPHYPQSNGQAESAVKIAKRLLRQDDMFAALMEYRATPIEATGLSPAEMLMGRRIRTFLPNLPSALTPDWSERDDVRIRDAKYRERAKQHYDQHNGCVVPLPELQPGDHVRVKTDTEKAWVTKGVVKDVDADTRSYNVATPKGNIRRNRRHLMLTPEPKPSEPVESSGNKTSVPTQPETADVSKPIVTRSGRVVKRKTFEDHVQ